MDNRKQLLWALKENESATQFIEIITDVLHLWDDLIDKDKKLPDKEINEKMWLAIVSLPINQFYRENFTVLHPILINAIQNWHTANSYEKRFLSGGSEDLLHVSFIIRSSYCELLTMCATLVGGPDWGHEVSLAVRDRWHDETFSGYKASLLKEQEDRKRLESSHGMQSL